MPLSPVHRRALGLRPSPQGPAPSRGRRGFALESTLIVLALLGVLTAVVLTWVITVTRASGVDYRLARVNHAAEAGADAIMAQLEVAMEDGVLTEDELDDLEAPELPGFIFTEAVAERAGGAVAKPIPSGPFTGLYALHQPVDVRITAQDSSSAASSVIVSVNAQSIPLFQFGVFYEEDLEIHPGAAMDFEGWVHTNSNLYLNAGSLRFRNLLTTPDSVFWQRKNTSDGGRLTGVKIDNAAGVAKQLNSSSRSEDKADDALFRSWSESQFNSRLMTKAHGVARLRLPLPPGMDPIELIKPRNSGTDTEAARKVKFAWKADWNIEIDLSSVMAPNGLCNQIIAAASTRAVGKVKPTLAQCKDIFSFEKDAFSDRREGQMVDALEVDVGKLGDWGLGSADRESQILYITFVDGSGTSGVIDYPVVRLRNANELKHKISVATSHPLYILGNFNTIGWKPASILADAVTILSGRWDDAVTTAKPPAADTGTKVFAAIAAGHSATPCDFKRTGCGSSSAYGGGLENFPRFLESWSSGRKVTYRGSLVSLFQSKIAVGLWNVGIPTGSYYDAPVRDWKFDLRFQDPENLPPGTPTVGTVLQVAFRPVY